MSDANQPSITLLQQREIEAKVIGPLIRAVIDEIGEERGLALLRRVITDLARQSGADLARSVGESSLQAFSTCLDRWTAGGALELQILANTPDRLEFDVTRCRYAELYHRLGLADLGPALSCARDFALIEGFNPDITLTRTETLMEGQACCNFRFARKAGSDPS